MSESKPIGIKIDHGSLSQAAKATPKPAFVGAWATIELQPDLFAPQRFTVGVAVQSADERLHFKLLDDFKKFECVYPDVFPQKSARELMAYAAEALQQAVKAKLPLDAVRFESHCLSISPPVFTSGEDREDKVERLFAEVVTMAPSPKKRGSDFETIDTPNARRLVNRYLKEIAGIDFERFVQEEQQGLLVDGDDGSRHFLDLNLLTPTSCGSVTSAVYKTSTTVEMNLLKASLDLKTCWRKRHLNSMGLFLLLPDPQAMERKEYKRIEEVIGDHEWKLEQDGFQVVSMQQPAELAREIYDWAKPALA
ncbi:MULTISPECIES: hypothetical protein [unclassified Undibacterium]|uniref:hypothetical protein n=1 Tax=unclassified Undibacterium TaxID=2630295 RepID=UPI002AC8BB55|nr:MULTISPECIES: hypothetical protein [unclassified Undibacterium]MEB0139454.1 hypothetical protein [Undibacterium sp. CCC2.1]MEB0171664.1 hypothetical protein [Undibacterium sp. CCC1.1]MEB0176198.1 hypothetical protein [Undibacterium sp. CCC3.4]MEB0215009.1 hypothetical protein [Undibacterium sp. 5I2]WPX43209.1 hypothetical protein RHM61_17790 [Undibacterium sp. CCC3.4]